MIWTLKKLVARRSARKATAPESSPVQNDTAPDAAEAAAYPAGNQAIGVDTAEASGGQAAEPTGEQAAGATATEPAAERAEAVETAQQAAQAEDSLEGAGTAAASADAKPADSDSSGDVKPADAAPEAGDAGTEEQPAAKPTKRRRAPKLDPLLAADVETARKAVLDIAPAAEVGEHAGVKAEDDRVVTHLFESNVRGYKGWQWFAVLARVPRGKVATVSEVGLLPSDRSLLSPEWIPWAERVRPEEKKQAEAEAGSGQVGDDTDVEQNGGSGGH